MLAAAFGAWLLGAILPRLAVPDTDVSDPASLTRLNSMVAPFGWLMTWCCAVPALLFWGETRWLVTACVVFCAAYLLLYRQMLKGKAPV